METRIVVGLGNPGPEHEDTRHNVGFEIVERIAARHRFPDWVRIDTRLQVEGEIAGRAVTLIRPLTFMNRSGQALAAFFRQAPFDPSELLVCYDDLALPLGRVRLRREGSAGGHNGMRSIISHLGTEGFPRLRVGIAPESGSVRDASAFVLRRFGRREVNTIDEGIGRAADAIECVFEEGLTIAMNRYNPEPS